MTVAERPEREQEALRNAGPVWLQTPCVDTETYAEIWGTGYGAAVAQGLADDPTLADDWLQAKLDTARAEGAAEVRARVEAVLAELQAVERATASGVVGRKWVVDHVRAALTEEVDRG